MVPPSPTHTHLSLSLPLIPQYSPLPLSSCDYFHSKLCNGHAFVVLCIQWRDVSSSPLTWQQSRQASSRNFPAVTQSSRSPQPEAPNHFVVIMGMHNASRSKDTHQRLKKASVPPGNLQPPLHLAHRTSQPLRLQKVVFLGLGGRQSVVLL